MRLMLVPFPRRLVAVFAFLAVVLTLVVSTKTAAQDISDKFSVHGYLTQAYAEADKLPINGISKDGTWDYRVVALQMRYAMTDKDQFVVQVRNRHLGSGLLNDDGVVIDWAYYRRDFGPAAVKIGHVPFPLGLYNELRLVGTVLPFYRAPSVFYLAGIETIQGASLSHRQPLGPWSLESTVYWGGETVKTPIVTPTGSAVLTNRAENIYGAQEWLNTPIQGLRVGAAFHHFKAPLPDLSDTTANNLYAASLDGTFDRFFVRGEYMRYNVERALVTADIGQINYYGQGGVKLFEPLWLNVQLEYGKSDYAGFKFRSTDDKAVGVSYMFSPNKVLKIEAHTVKGYSFDTFVDPTGPAGKTNYGIASMSVSF
jgi:hypothetical protein